MQFKHLKVSDIRECPVVVRPVDKRSDDYRRLCESIRAKGVLTPIIVRQKELDLYQVVDGIARFFAVQDLGHETIPAFICVLNDIEVLEIQLITSIHRLPVKRHEYVSSLMRLISTNPTLRLMELAEQLNADPQWIVDMLELKVAPEILPLLFNGKINLANAYSLAKLPLDEQKAFKERAEALPPMEFVPLAQRRLRDLRSS